jgi:hypothetical protein
VPEHLPTTRPNEAPSDPAETPDAGSLWATARRVLEDHWRAEGYAVPNAATYPHQWLWDSCFHAVIWAHLGEPERATAELAAVFARQGPDGFVPHMTYWTAPHVAGGFWGRDGVSCITQPPMYGHALAELSRAGITVPNELVTAARRGLVFLLEARRAGGAGGVRIVHPWESGCDDSPRWDAWCPGPAWDLTAWRAAKSAMVGALAADGRRHAADATGPTSNPMFSVESAGFTALVAFNAAELASVTGDTTLRLAADELADVLVSRWQPEVSTWADASVDGRVGSSVRTADSLLPALVVNDRAQVAAALAQLADPDAFGGPFGPAGVHRLEPSFDPDRYWRGPVWPQVAYLLWLAACRAGHAEVAASLAADTALGAVRSGWSEHWHPDTAVAQGAAPQSWTGLVAVMAAPVN